MIKNDQKMKKTNSQKTHIIFKNLKIRFLSDFKISKK